KWGLIILGLGIFVVGVTFPIWYGTIKSTPAPVLSLDTPVINSMQNKKCVEDTAFMRGNHMKMLDVWRDEVVRKGQRKYTAKDGRKYEKSLTGTCIQCHSNKEQFCDRCHNYVGAKPTCFSCHVVPGEVKK
ncbi:MAG TPA: sulfate reduction electron transfer complex DsrMKJOP subunit DsrJ, partial [Smithellaceae bacterium]|nr:sulfate reduction electron transfer complex DsrMKJOP subunit DsrJ [Smithellaceae bacterium]